MQVAKAAGSIIWQQFTGAPMSWSALVFFIQWWGEGGCLHPWWLMLLGCISLLPLEVITVLPWCLWQISHHDLSFSLYIPQSSQHIHLASACLSLDMVEVEGYMFLLPKSLSSKNKDSPLFVKFWNNPAGATLAAFTSFYRWKMSWK